MRLTTKLLVFVGALLLLGLVVFISRPYIIRKPVVEVNPPNVLINPDDIVYVVFGAYNEQCDPAITDSETGEDIADCRRRCFIAEHFRVYDREAIQSLVQRLNQSAGQFSGVPSLSGVVSRQVFVSNSSVRFLQAKIYSLDSTVVASKTASMSDQGLYNITNCRNQSLMVSDPEYGKIVLDLIRDYDPEEYEYLLKIYSEIGVSLHEAMKISQ